VGKVARSIDDQSNLLDDGRVTCREGENSRHHPGLLSEFVRRWRTRGNRGGRAVGRRRGAPMHVAAAAAAAVGRCRRRRRRLLN